MRTLPCVITGVTQCIEAAHIRDGYYAMGSKPSDARAVPLHYMQHKDQHQRGEIAYWGKKRLDAAKWLARAVYNNTGDYEECCRLIMEFRNAFPNCE